MPIRPFKLPDDLSTLMELIPPSFQYPENEEWSIQSDDIESMVDAMNGIRRIWPVIWFAQRVAPPLRDVLLGYIWEEDGKAVGLSNVMRQGSTDRWYIANVGVLPEYRRRGIARQLVEACVQLARGRNAKSISLDVVTGNLPAFTLYQRLGFEHYSGQSEMTFNPPGHLADPQLPAGYTLDHSARSNWRARYELAQRITPEAVRVYMPVEEGRFRLPAVLNVLGPVINVATGMMSRTITVRTGGQAVATGRYSARKRKGGVNNIDLMLDPAHAALAPHLWSYLVGAVEQQSPGRRIDCILPQWQAELMQAALDSGFSRRVDHDRMGLRLE